MSQRHGDFSALLRHWREARRFSQLELAMQADISSKHVSFLETGRNRPSREMILRLSSALALPHRDCNSLLYAAGFAPAFSEKRIGDAEVKEAEFALSRILEKHEPYPAIVLDSDWRLVRQNHGSYALGQLMGMNQFGIGDNAMDFLFREDGLKPYIENWEVLGSVLLLRVYREVNSPGSSASQHALLDRLLSYPATPENWREIAIGTTAGPTLDMVIRLGELRLSFFTTLTTFGTAQDVTLQELRIESYFPADDVTRQWCESA